MADTKKLFESVVLKLNKIIEDGETVLDKEGQAIRQEAAPAYFAQAVNLLKMVGETGKSDKPSIKAQIKELALPFAEVQTGTERPYVQH